MADFMGLMKQAAQLQSKMQALQAELDQIEVEGTAGGGMVSVRLSAKGDLKGIKVDDSLMQALGKGNPRGPAGGRPCRRPPQGGGRNAGEDEGAHRRPDAAAGLWVGVKMLGQRPFGVMPGLDPGIHLFAKMMDCRVKPGNDK